MPLKEDIKPYIKNGFIHPSIDSDSGNGWLYTAEYLIALEANKEKLTIAEDNNLFLATQMHQIMCGLLIRTPTNAYGVEGPDDYIGACFISNFLYPSLAKDILFYGRTFTAEGSMPGIAPSDLVLWKTIKEKEEVSFVYNNIMPRTFCASSWLGRFPHLIAALQLVAGEKLSVLKLLYLAGSFMFINKNNDCDSWIRPWVLSHAVKEKHWLIDLTIKWWKRKATKLWGTPGQLLSKYFNKLPEGQPEHPLALYLMNKEF